MADKTDEIFECAENFRKLMDIEYKFIVARNRITQCIKVNFLESDFYHLAGFQYLSDIAIPRNKKEIIENVTKGLITDRKLRSSRYYKESNNDEKNIEHRIRELVHIEQYLDNDNIIRIFTTRNTPYVKSMINAEYIIESRLKSRNKTVYIFLNRRKEDDSHYGIVSFFEKNNVTYSGDALYWMLKEKIVDDTITVLYKHPDYNE